LSSSFQIENGLKQGDALSPLLFNFALEYDIKNVQETKLGLDMNATHQVLAYADDVNLIGDDIRRGLGIDGRTILEWTLKR
jgi:Reverse transcriptase (RNA-dependent DNA polymerase).